MKNFTIDENFFTRLDQAIRSSGMRANEIAAMAGIGEPYLSFLRRGKRKNPSAQLVQSLAEILACDLHWLITGEENPGASYRMIHGIAPTTPLDLSESDRKALALARGQHGLVADIASTPQTETDSEVAAKLAERPAELCRKMADPELLQYHSEFLSQMVDESRQVFRATHATMLEAIANEFDARLRTARTT